MTTPPKTLGALLRHLRDKTPLSQSDVSKLVGVSQALYSTWESDGAIPKKNKVAELAKALRSDPEEFTPFYQDVLTTRDSDVLLPRLQKHAREFVQDHAKKHGRAAHDIWILGGTNLDSMRNIDLMEGHWKELLRAGFTYHFIWVLDLLDDTFGTVLTTLAALARNVWEEKGGKAGKVIHYAVQGYKPAPDALRRYRSFMKATEEATKEATASKASVDAGGYIETMHDLSAIDKLAWEAGRKEALREAVNGILREWQRDTGIVAYRPIRHATPPAANIRLMPLSKEIVTNVAPDVEGHGRWFWLSPTLTQRLMLAINSFWEAVESPNSDAQK